jgi:predicted CopG family antitoxin
MKTISLTDSAYYRLKTWKTSQRESFSQVVERLVPAKGTLGQIEAVAASLPRLTDDEAKTLDACLAEFKDWAAQRDPWTT